MRISKEFWVAVLVGLLVLGVRVPGLSSFMTVDEENWMLRSAGFYHKLFRDGDTGGAFMTTHPGATAMWVAGAGIVTQEARLGFDVDTSNLIYFRKAATLPVAVVVSVLVGITTLLLARLFGWRPGVVGGVLLAVEPYLVGMGQIAHLDMLLALFMLNSMLTFLLASHRFTLRAASPRPAADRALSQLAAVKENTLTDRPASLPKALRVNRWLALTISGIFAGLAMGTKLLPALWLFVFFAAVLSVGLSRKVAFGDHGTALWILFKQSVRRMGFIIGVSALTFYAVWPALWFTADLGRSFEKDIPYVVQDVHVAIDESDPVAPASFYVRTLLGRTTPFVLILSIGSLVSVARYVARERKISNIMWLIVYALGFLAFITFAAKKADRYALPALVVLPVVAGWALALGFEVFSRSSATKFFARLALRLQQAKPPTPTRKKFVAFGSAIVFVLLLAQLFIWIPHSITYNSPLFPNIRPLSQQGWGEGLEEAARWLNQHPLAEELYVASWYPGVMETYFHGKTFSLSSRSDSRASYVVLYRNMLGRAPDTIASDVIDEYRGKHPDHIVSINGTPYVWIYATSSTEIYKQHAGELVGQRTVGQLVPVDQDSWQTIEIGMANFSNRANTQDIVLHVRESLEAQQDVRTVRVNASEIADGVFHRFEFEPITGAASKTYYVFLDSPTSRPGDAVTVRFVNKDILPGEMVKDGVVLPGRDVAYRVP